MCCTLYRYTTLLCTVSSKLMWILPSQPLLVQACLGHMVKTKTDTTRWSYQYSWTITVDTYKYIQYNESRMTVMLSSMKPLLSPGWGCRAHPSLQIFSALAEALVMSCWTMLKFNAGILFLHSWQALLASLHTSRVLTTLLALSLSINVQGSMSSWARAGF